MKRFLLAFVLILGCNDDGYGCQRCGHSACILAAPKVAVAAVPVYQPAYAPTVTNFVFQSNSPAYPLVGNSSTILFEPLRAEVYANQAARLSEAAIELQKSSIAGVERVASASLAIEEQRTLYAALLQAAGKSQPVSKTLQVQITTDQYGQVQVKPIDPMPANESPKVQAVAAVSSVIQSKCLKCHGPAKQEGDVRFDQGVSEKLAFRSFIAVGKGKMPKGGSLTPAEKNLLVDELDRAVSK